MARLLSTVQTVDVVFQSEDLTHESQLSRRVRPFRRAREWMGFPLRGRSRSGRARTTRDPSYAAVASAISTRPFAKAASRPALKPTCFAARSRLPPPAPPPPTPPAPPRPPRPRPPPALPLPPPPPSPPQRPPSLPAGRPPVSP